jgi:proteasome accessory factor B
MERRATVGKRVNFGIARGRNSRCMSDMPRPRASVRPTKTQRFSRPPLARMMQLHQQLQAGRFPNCRKLAGKLEVSAKTIQRDLEFMRSQLGLPIEYDQLHFGFYYSEPVTHFPSVEVSESEIVALFVAQKALAQYRGTSFEKPLQAAFQKIADGLEDKFTFPWSDLDAAVSFRGLGTTVADLETFETVSSAVLKCHELQFEYRKLGSAGYESRRVQPYHLACIDQQWYLFAHDLARKQLRTFVLSRMRQVRDARTRFHRPADFSINRHLGGSLGVFAGRGRLKVRIHFDAFAARLVSERLWHASQRIRELDEGALELSLELASLEEIERWVLSWGAHARVLEPAALKNLVRLAAERVLAAS